jgi:PAS domain S-box-containing protein
MLDVLKLFAYLGDGVWAVDAEGRIVFWNQAARLWLGYPPEEVVGQFCTPILACHDSNEQPLCGPRCSVRAPEQWSEAAEPFDLQVRCRDGRRQRINVSVVAIPGESGAERGAALVCLFRVSDEAASRPRPLRISLLGPMVVERPDGTVVDGLLWRRAKVRALLVLLALRRGQPVHRTTLLELWPDLEYAAALRNLNTMVYDLRRSLEPGLQEGAESGYIQYQDDCYALGGHAYWLDVTTFERGLSAARHERDASRAEHLYQEALGLYRGDFLADLDPDLLGSWMERERLRELYLSALQELATLMVTQRREQEAGELYMKMLVLDPCRESAARQLMRLALDRGDRAVALAHHRRLKEALWRELQILPDRETQRLYEKVSRGG